MKPQPGFWMLVPVTLIACGAISCNAQAGAIQCPLQITVHEQTDASALTGWRAFSSNPHEIHPFYGVSFSQGSPADEVYLSPRKSASTTKGKIEEYDFYGEIPGDLWISCLYRDTSQIVAQRIDPKPLKCKVLYDPRRLSTVKSVNCD